MPLHEMRIEEITTNENFLRTGSHSVSENVIMKNLIPDFTEYLIYRCILYGRFTLIPDRGNRPRGRVDIYFPIFYYGFC